MIRSYKSLLLLIFLFVFFSCSIKNEKFSADFNEVNDRVWIGQDFWAIPMEDWQVNKGRIECIGERKNMRVNVLSHIISDKNGRTNMSVRMGLLNEGSVISSSGFRIGINDPEDDDVKPACYFGNGTNAGIRTDKQLFIEQKTISLPNEFDLKDFVLSLEYKCIGSRFPILTLSAKDKDGNTASIEQECERLQGLIAIVNHYTKPENFKDAPRFWFDDLKISGSNVLHQPQNNFGPILWSMYTLSRNTVKLTVQMPPLGKADNNKVSLLLDKEGSWEIIDEQQIQKDAHIASFRLENWDATKEVPYRILYNDINEKGKAQENLYDGLIRRDPIDKTLSLGGLTCQYGTGFPYTPLVKNLTIHNPDMLYFSGDQMYEGNGGYNIIRTPADRAILNYLGKWYMFGWAFGELMRDRPTINTPDDHDVFQGNLWGDNGKKIEMPDWRSYQGTSGGYVMPWEMINVVHKTQCLHLPDPYDSTPLKQGILPYYTDLVYGRVSFAIITDRGFKSGPNEVEFWDGRKDHVKTRLPDMSVIDKPNLKLIGDGQTSFLKNWITDWRGADMKVILSQTVFSNIATHHGGNQEIIFADLDSGGWPKTARDNLIRIMRKAFSFHIVGDQHLPSISQYGIDEFSDAGWCYCTPAIFVGYERRFLPSELGYDIDPVTDNSDPNTGFYKDPFGNLQYVHAIGNPERQPVRTPRYQFGQEKSSGYGLIHFDQINRTIKMEAYRFLADLSAEDENNQFPGWPYTIDQIDNYGRTIKAYLPPIKVIGIIKPVLMVYDGKTGELVYSIRMKDEEWTPGVFELKDYTLRIGDPDIDKWRIFNNLKSTPEIQEEMLIVDFN